MEKSSHVIDNLKISLFKTQESLAIEVENQQSLAHYTFTVTNDVIPALTNQLFDDADALYAGILSALNSNPDTKLSMIEDGKLEFLHKTKIGKTEKNFSFIMILEEKVLDSVEKMKKQIERLLTQQADYETNQEEMRKKVKEQEERVANQSANEIMLLKTIEELASQVRKLEEIIVGPQTQQKVVEVMEPAKTTVEQDKPDFYFNSNCPNKSKLNFRNQDKTMSFVRGGGFAGALAILPLSPVNKQFSIRIETASKAVMVGIVSSKLKDAKNFYTAKGSYLFDGSSNRLRFHAVEGKEGFSKEFSKGSVITVTLDFDANEIAFCLDNSETIKERIDGLSANDDTFYPCVEIYGKAEVTFI